MRAHLDSQRDWLIVERLPACAPQLNPVEYLWANLKDVELANLPTTTLADVADVATQGIHRVFTSEDLVTGSLPTLAHLRLMSRQPNPRNSISNPRPRTGSGLSAVLRPIAEVDDLVAQIRGHVEYLRGDEGTKIEKTCPPEVEFKRAGLSVCWG
jgi:hypothetical protein